MYLVVSEHEAARETCFAVGSRSAKCSTMRSGVYAGSDEPYLWPAPGRRPAPRAPLATARLPRFRDPDGNGWLFQEVTARLPGRIDSAATTFASVSDLVGALQRAEAAHGGHEKRLGHRDEEWPKWYAEYMDREQRARNCLSRGYPYVLAAVRQRDEATSWLGYGERRVARETQTDPSHHLLDVGARHRLAGAHELQDALRVLVGQAGECTEQRLGPIGLGQLVLSSSASEIPFRSGQPRPTALPRMTTVSSDC